MTKNLKKYLALFMIAILSLSLVSCGNAESESKEKTEEKLESKAEVKEEKKEEKKEAAKDVEQVFRINISSEPSILDPFQYRDANAGSVIYAIHEPLIRKGEDMNDWEPGLATDVKSNDDATVYTVSLRDNINWSDGTPITAEDIVYSFVRAVDPAFASPKAFDYYILKNGEAIVNGEMEPEEVGVKALDDSTIEFTLERPIDYFMDYLMSGGFLPIQKAAAEEHGELYGTEPDRMVASGPFIMESWSHDASITLVKNEHYWDADNVTLDKVEISLVQDANTILGMYETEELDYIELSIDVLPQYEEDPNLDSIDMTRVSFIEFNPRVDFLENKNIRQALSMSFDRQAYAGSILKQPDLAAYGLVPYGIRGIDGGDFREQAGNIVVDLATEPGAEEKAKELLATGLEELGKTKEEFEDFFEVNCVDNPGSKSQAQAIQAMWKQYLDLDVAVVPLQVKMLVPMLMEGTFHCVVGGGRTAGFSDAATFIDFIYYENKWDDDNFRGLMEDSFEQVGNERIETLMEAEKYVLENYVYVPQVFSRNNYIIREGVEGFNVYPSGIQYDYKHVVITE